MSTVTPSPAPTTERQTAVDTLKCIGAFMVVVLHYGYVIADDGVGRATFVVNAITCAAVPIFFMITGFYFILSYRRGRIGHQVRRLLTLTAFAVVLYAVFYYGWYLVRGKLPELINNLRWHDDAVREISKMVIFNELPKAFHLWYLLAAAMAIGAMWAFERWRLWGRPLIAFFVLVFIAASILSAYSNYPYYYIRNFFTVGIPAMVIGRWIYETQSHQRTWLTSPKVIFGGIFLAIVLIAVQMLLHIDDVGMIYRAQFDIPLAAPMLAAALLLLTIRFPMMGRATFLPVIGAKYSGYIYVFHVIPGTVLRTWIKAEDYLSLLAPFVVFTIALGMSVVWVRIKKAYPDVKILQLI